MNPLRVVPQEIIDGVLWLAIAMPDGFTREDVARQCKIPLNTAYRAMRRLAMDGVISITWIGKGCVWTTSDKIDALRQRMQDHYTAKRKQAQKRDNINYKRRQAERGAAPAKVPLATVPRWVFDLA
jgi:hypothetical protein